MRLISRLQQTRRVHADAPSVNGRQTLIHVFKTMLPRQLTALTEKQAYTNQDETYRNLTLGQAYLP